MTVISDTLANTTRAAHDVGLAAWLGGTMFGRFAHNPSLEQIDSHVERGKVANTAWNGYNLINSAALGAAAVGWLSARATETRSSRLTDTEQRLAQAKDVLMLVALSSGIISGVAGAQLAKQEPDGAVPLETGTKPAPETPKAAARLQRVINLASVINISSGIALVSVNGVMAQINYSHPAPRRLFGSNAVTDALSSS